MKHLCAPLVALLLAAAAPSLPAAEIDPELLQRLAAGPQQAIVVFDTAAVRAEVARLKAAGTLSAAAEGELKAERFRVLKAQALAALPDDPAALVRDYPRLPLATVRLRDSAALRQLAARSEVVSIHPDRLRQPALVESLPLIGQPVAAASGATGAGTTVVVLDSGVDYTRSAFGSCTAPGKPTGCKVIHLEDLAKDDGMLDDRELHGTNVSGIVVGVAPETKLAVFDIFGRGGGADSDILAGIDWAVAHQQEYNIASVNLSLGSGYYRNACTSSPYASAFTEARAAGIVPVVAAGNEAHKDGLAEPACAPGAVAVGAVYDSDMGRIAFAECTDRQTRADLVTCYSDSSRLLTLLAPGDEIIAAGVKMGGTSQATPMVSGASAVLAAAFPSEGVEQRVTRMTDSGTPVTDPGNGLTFPRLDLPAALALAVEPSVDLAVSWAKARQSCRGWWVRSCTVNGTVVVTNSGTATADATEVAIYLSTTPALTADAVEIDRQTVTALAAGGSTTLQVRYPVAAGGSVGGEYLIAVVDTAGTITESDEENNSAVSAVLR